MHIVEKILGNISDAEWKERLKTAGKDWLELNQWEAQKTRLRKDTAAGRSLAIALERGSFLHDGDILLWDEKDQLAVICHIRLCPVMAVDLAGLQNMPRNDALAAGVRLGHALGNQHWPAVVRDGMVYVPMMADSKVMGAVMDTHAIPGITYMFLAGEHICELLEPGEARCLFGGADVSSGEHHIHDTL